MVIDRFETLEAPVQFLVFVEANGSPYCEDTRQLAEEIVDL
jgi:hypothetical protein